MAVAEWYASGTSWYTVLDRDSAWDVHKSGSYQEPEPDTLGMTDVVGGVKCPIPACPVINRK